MQRGRWTAPRTLSGAKASSQTRRRQVGPHPQPLAQRPGCPAQPQPQRAGRRQQPGTRQTDNHGGAGHAGAAGLHRMMRPAWRVTTAVIHSIHVGRVRHAVHRDGSRRIMRTGSSGVPRPQQNAKHHEDQRPRNPAQPPHPVDDAHLPRTAPASSQPFQIGPRVGPVNRFQPPDRATNHSVLGVFPNMELQHTAPILALT